MLSDLRAFLLRGNVVDLAVGVVLGTAFGAVVSSLVEDVVTPVIAAIGGEPDFSDLRFHVNGSVFRYGEFLNAVVTFLIVGTAVFFAVVRPINALVNRFRTEPTQPDTRSCPECLSEIPVGARRCAHCTAVVAP